jgi:hypothetical protein
MWQRREGGRVDGAKQSSTRTLLGKDKGLESDQTLVFMEHRLTEACPVLTPPRNSQQFGSCLAPPEEMLYSAPSYLPA